MSQDRRINYGSPLMGGSIGSISGMSIADSATINTIHIGGEVITAEDIVKFKKLLGFMDFALAASEELRNLMVAYEAKQRILK